MDIPASTDCMAVGWSLRLSPFQGETWEFNNDRVNVILQGNLVDVDTDMQTMTIDWYIGLYGCNIEPCPDVNIYFDQGYVVQDSNNSSAPQNNEMPDPVFFLNATDYLYLNLTDWRQNSPIFRTDLQITNMFTHRSAQAYPFDKYTAVITLWAFTPNMDIVKVYIGWTGVVAIWLVTLTFLMACITNVFFGKGVRGELLVLPVATLFAFTALRGTMPGAPPGFGADINFMGILPCLALLTSASVFMCAVFLFRSDPGEDTRRWKTMTVDKMS
ncbi:hypothetical protein WOLCODRAFT_153664 [Wolfiporia cocos MD-104 SS10]|uniref:Uncharacterized protein n=1 Tax=Wolfiporia cocos (strain MD-104) TaxID=742152 RepID=A0A2H3JNZ1_WOLCO|nr:hypothetical protein WOLCODRAFT_153664 [Wolfiporia cocos MD-104 SS10]